MFVSYRLERYKYWTGNNKIAFQTLMLFDLCILILYVCETVSYSYVA